MPYLVTQIFAGLCRKHAWWTLSTLLLYSLGLLRNLNLLGISSKSLSWGFQDSEIQHNSLWITWGTWVKDERMIQSIFVQSYYYHCPKQWRKSKVAQYSMNRKQLKKLPPYLTKVSRQITIVQQEEVRAPVSFIHDQFNSLTKSTPPFTCLLKWDHKVWYLGSDCLDHLAQIPIASRLRWFLCSTLESPQPNSWCFLILRHSECTKII